MWLICHLLSLNNATLFATYCHSTMQLICHLLSLNNLNCLLHTLIQNVTHLPPLTPYSPFTGLTHFHFLLIDNTTPLPLILFDDRTPLPLALNQHATPLPLPLLQWYNFLLLPNIQWFDSFATASCSVLPLIKSNSLCSFLLLDSLPLPVIWWQDLYPTYIMQPAVHSHLFNCFQSRSTIR